MGAKKIEIFIGQSVIKNWVDLGCKKIEFFIGQSVMKNWVDLGCKKNLNFYWSVCHGKLGRFRVQKN